MKNFTLKFQLVCVFLVLGFSLSFAQVNPEKTNENTSITMKTLRALFPGDVPVGIANEIHGGLHVVTSIDELHGVDGSGDLQIKDAVLQKGMIVYVDEIDVQKFYVYIGPGQDPAYTGYINLKDGTLQDVDNDGVDDRYWRKLSDFITISIPDETINVVSGCTYQYTFTVDGVLNKTGASGATTDGIKGKEPGDHLILMGASGTPPIATYVFNGGEWRLAYRANQVIPSSETTNWSINVSGVLTGAPTSYNWAIGDIIKIGDKSYAWTGSKWINIGEINNQDDDDVAILATKTLDANGVKTTTDVNLNTDPAGNGYLSASYKEGDLIKLQNGNSYVTYMKNADGNWMIIASGTSPNSTLVDYPIYSGTYDGTAIGTPSVFTNRFISLDAFRATNTEGFGRSIGTGPAESGGVYIEYPATWGNLNYQLCTDITATDQTGLNFEITNGFMVELIEKDIPVSSASGAGTVKVLYKRVMIKCGTESIRVN